MPEYREVATLADVDELKETIEEFASDMWATDPETGRVDWEEWFERFEARGYSFPGDWDDPVIRKVKRIAKQAIRESIG